MKQVFAIILILSVFLLNGCTVSTYGKSLEPIPHSDTYTLKVYIGGFSGGETADKAAAEEIKSFMKKNDFESYEIVSRRHNLIPSYFEYHVKFQNKDGTEKPDKSTATTGKTESGK